MKRSTTRCHTHTGQGFDPFRPRVEDIRVEDIAHHLALINRYGGACPEPYSVAQHAVHVADLVWEFSADPATTLAALHHDSAEAYIGDQRRPIKGRLACLMGGVFLVFDNLEGSVLDAIFEAFGIAPPKGTLAKMVKDSDEALLVAEMNTFFGESRKHWVTFGEVKPWPWKRAKATFLKRHNDLIAKMRATAKEGVKG